MSYLAQLILWGAGIFIAGTGFGIVCRVLWQDLTYEHEQTKREAGQ